MYYLLPFLLFRLSQSSYFTSKVTQYNFTVSQFLVSPSSRSRTILSFLLPAQKNIFSKLFFFLVFPFLHSCFLDFLPAMFHSFLLDSYLPRSASVPFISLVSCTQTVKFPITFLPLSLFLLFQFFSSLPFVFEFPYHLSSLGILFDMSSSLNSSSRFIFRLSCIFLALGHWRHLTGAAQHYSIIRLLWL